MGNPPCKPPIIQIVEVSRYSELIQHAAQMLRTHPGPIYLAAHPDPDGDSVGSMLGLYRALHLVGQEAYWICQVPRYLCFLVDGDQPIAQLEDLPEQALLVVLDTSPQRLDGVNFLPEQLSLNIDHHATNPQTCTFNIVDPARPATTHMVMDLIEALGLAWNPQLATPILTGLMTDTGFFQHGNTSPQLLRDAATLLPHVAYAELTDRLKWRPQSYFPTLGAVLSTVQFHFGGRLVTAHLPQGTYQDDSDDFVGVIRQAEGTDLAIFLRRKGDDTKVSIRSKGTASALAVALRLGGGGHRPAAGATLRATHLEAAYPLVLQAVQQSLEESGVA